MKILIDARVLSVQRGGVARIILNLLNEFSSHEKIKIVCLVMEGSSTPLPKLDNVKYVYMSWPLGVKRLMRFFVENTKLYVRILKEKPEIVFCPNYTAPLLMTIYRPFKLVMGIWDITYSTHSDHYTWYERLVLQVPSRNAARIADMIVTCSSFDAHQIQRYFKIDAEKIHVLKLNADKKFFSEEYIEKPVKYLRSNDITKKYILSLGVIYRRRMVPEIIQAFVELKVEQKLEDNLQLLIVGKNQIRPKFDLERLIRSSHNWGVRYIEFVPEQQLTALFKFAQSYICISEVDGEAILVKEAVALGTPIITTKMLSSDIDDHATLIDSPVTVDEIKRSILKAVETDPQLLNYQASIAKKNLTYINAEAEYKKLVTKILQRVS